MSEALPELFARALELDDAGRRALVDEVASSDPALGAELARLLESAGEAGSPLDFAPWRPDDEPEASGGVLPERIGPYRILRELGRGGMGRVFLAEEETEDFRRAVALKVIDRPAGDDDAVRRFRDEVRILSSLEHPGIARFLAGGRTPDGAWFLALELVEGEDLLSYARARELPVRARLELFVTVLDAVRFAHGRGVVHRDLKPGHLLVDREGRPRLLDFGISKLVDPATQQSLALTRTESRALTPAYASPEQFRGEPVTPASDVYALGTILYELLAGRRPFAGEQGSALALERAVLGTDPEPPSTAARQVASGPSAKETRISRAPPFTSLGRDLDEICLKALRKAPTDRYADAGELAADLRRYLSGEPVAARRGGRRYRFARFARRHRAPLAVAGALLVAVAALWTAVDAGRRAAIVAPEPPAPRPFPFSNIGSVPLAELRRQFVESPASAEAGAALVLGLTRADQFDEARLILARLRQIPGEEQHPLTDYADANLAMDVEEPQRALVLFTRARDGAIARRRGDLVAQIRASRGRLLATIGQRDEARREMEMAAREFASAGDHASLSRVLNDLAIEDLQQGKLDEGQALLERAVAEARAAGTTPGTMLGNLASLAAFRGRPDRAETIARELVADRRQAGNRRQLGGGLLTLAEALHDLGRAAEAQAATDESIALLREAGHLAWLPIALYLRGIADIQAARFERVAAIVSELETIAASAGGYGAMAGAHYLRAFESGARGETAAMRASFAAGRKLRVQNGDLDQVASGDAWQAQLELRAGHLAEARRLADLADRGLPATAVDGEPAFLAAAIRACVDAREGKTAAARRGLDGLGDAAAASPSVGRRLAYLEARAALASAEGRPDDARRDLQAAIAAATAADRTAEALELGLDLAGLDSAAGAGIAGGAAPTAIAAAAEALGLRALATRARALTKQAAAPRAD